MESVRVTQHRICSVIISDTWLVIQFRSFCESRKGKTSKRNQRHELYYREYKPGGTSSALKEKVSLRLPQFRFNKVLWLYILSDRVLRAKGTTIQQIKTTTADIFYDNLALIMIWMVNSPLRCNFVCTNDVASVSNLYHCDYPICVKHIYGWNTLARWQLDLWYFVIFLI